MFNIIRPYSFQIVKVIMTTNQRSYVMQYTSYLVLYIDRDINYKQEHCDE